MPDRLTEIEDLLRAMTTRYYVAPANGRRLVAVEAPYLLERLRKAEGLLRECHRRGVLSERETARLLEDSDATA